METENLVLAVFWRWKRLCDAGRTATSTQNTATERTYSTCHVVVHHAARPGQMTARDGGGGTQKTKHLYSVAAHTRNIPLAVQCVCRAHCGTKWPCSRVSCNTSRAPRAGLQVGRGVTRHVLVWTPHGYDLVCFWSILGLGVFVCAYHGNRYMKTGAKEAHTAMWPLYFFFGCLGTSGVVAYCCQSANHDEDNEVEIANSMHIHGII